MSVKYSFIGVGNISRAILSAMENIEGKIKPSFSDIYLYDKLSDKTLEFSQKGYVVTRSIDECIESADYVFLCVKPQNYREVLEYIRDSGISLSEKTFVSVAAGISTFQIFECRVGNYSVIRAMPNTPMTIGCGVCAICHNDYVNPKRFELICRILSSKAELVKLDENMMNKIIGITSSSPAYVYSFIDAINDAAKSEGFDDPRMLDIICKVFIGSAQMVLQSDKDIKSLINAVKSPNGTTERALNVLQSDRASDPIIKAVAECNKRADTLGQEM